MELHEFLSIPENKIRYDNFKLAFENKFPNAKFQDIAFNMEGNNIMYLAGKSAGEINSTELRRLFTDIFTHTL